MKKTVYIILLLHIVIIFFVFGCIRSILFLSLSLCEMALDKKLVRFLVRHRKTLFRPYYLLAILLIVLLYYTAQPLLKIGESYIEYNKLQREFPDFLAYTQSHAFPDETAPVHGDKLVSLSEALLAEASSSSSSSSHSIPLESTQMTGAAIASNR